MWTFNTAIEQIEYCGFECEGGPLTGNSAWQWLKAQVHIPERASRVTIAEIIVLVEEHFNLAPGRLSGPEQSREVYTPRHIAYKLARVHTLRSYPVIARAFNRADHTSIISGISSISKRMEKEPDTLAHYTQLNARLEQLAASNSSEEKIDEPSLSD